MNGNPLTKTGHARLKQELERRKTKLRPEIVEAIATAREHGDLRENAEYHAACEQQGFNEGRIRELESLLNSAQVIDPAQLRVDGRVVFGTTVELLKQSDRQSLRYQIVGAAESDVGQGRISIVSPLARALIGKSVNQQVILETDDGDVSYTVLKIEYC